MKLLYRVRLFGTYRDLFGEKEIELELPEKTALGDLREKLGEELIRLNPGLDARELLTRTAIASGNQILKETEALVPGLPIALLPPVCGG